MLNFARPSTPNKDYMYTLRENTVKRKKHSLQQYA
jgi:hypothetical protein